MSAPEKETSFFDGIDTGISGMFKALQRPAPAGSEEALAAIEREVKGAVQGFKVANPSACVPALARGLTIGGFIRDDG